MANLSVLNVAKHFGQTMVLESVDFAVRSGDVLAILGASGSGKTSLLRLIAGFEMVDRGSIEIDDVVVANETVHIPAEQRRVGYVPQHGALFPHLTVAENIGFGLPRAERGPRGPVAALLDMVGLPQRYAGRMPRELSGGEQQRVAVARSLAPKPKLVLLDEPFSALDAGLRLETRQAVATALAASGATAVLVTHDQSEAFSMGALVAVLRHGRIAQMASPQTLYNQPADIDLARFLGDAIIVSGIVKHGQIITSLGDLPVTDTLPEGEVKLLLRPEQINLVPPGTPHSVSAKVTEITYYGIDAMVGLHVDHAPAFHGQALAARVFNPGIPEIGAIVGIVIVGPATIFTAEPRPSSN